MSGESPKSMSKGERTQQRILEAALNLFTEKGYDKTTMRDIALEAGCSLGLAYHYFASKEELVLGLYRNLAEVFGEKISQLPQGPLSERFFVAMQENLKLVEPLREPMGALFAAALGPRSESAILGERAAEVRRRMGGSFLDLVRGSRDAPSAPISQHLSQILYIAHLGVLLFWLHDKSPQNQATQNLIAFARDVLEKGSSLFGLPWAAQILEKLTSAVSPVFGVPPEG